MEGGEHGRCRQVIGSSPFVRKIEAAKGFQSGFSDLVFTDPWRSRLNFSALLTRFLLDAHRGLCIQHPVMCPCSAKAKDARHNKKVHGNNQPTEPMSSDVECYWEKCYQEPCMFVFAFLIGQVERVLESSESLDSWFKSYNILLVTEPDLQSRQKRFQIASIGVGVSRFQGS